MYLHQFLFSLPTLEKKTAPNPEAEVTRETDLKMIHMLLPLKMEEEATSQGNQIASLS